MNCGDCGRTILRWEEPSLIATPPDWWPDDAPSWHPPVQPSTHLLCLHCGAHHVDIGIGNPDDTSLVPADQDDALHLEGL